ELKSSEESDIIQLVLSDGNYYEELVPKSNDERKKYPFAKAAFETYIINIEIPENTQDLEEERNVRTDKMKNISRLKKDIDSIRDNNITVIGAFSKNIVTRMGAFAPMSQRDTLEQAPEIEARGIDSRPLEVVTKDSITNTADLLGLFQEWQQGQIISAASNAISNILNSVSGKKQDIQNKYKIYNMHILSLHKKYALALSCIILFFVGAPLGAIIRKGGLGLPMVIAIVLFLTYYFIGVFAGNYAKEGNIHPILGAWLSTLIMLPLGVFLTRRATADRGLMSFGHVWDILTAGIRKRFKRKTP
ncbi:MAG: LptF/LptG family permease, partial [Muriicola sp.]|nr:LptF/LptG family permease [Muriicola sp.]